MVKKHFFGKFKYGNLNLICFCVEYIVNTCNIKNEWGKFLLITGAADNFCLKTRFKIVRLWKSYKRFTENLRKKWLELTEI